MVRYGSLNLCPAKISTGLPESKRPGSRFLALFANFAQSRAPVRPVGGGVWESGGEATAELKATAKGGLSMPLSREVTKEQLYRQAKRLGIKGRSKMSKSQLKSAVGRHHR